MLHMGKTHNLSAECEMAAADFRNIAPSMVQGFPADNHKGSSVLRLPPLRCDHLSPPLTGTHWRLYLRYHLGA